MGAGIIYLSVHLSSLYAQCSKERLAKRDTGRRTDRVLDILLVPVLFYMTYYVLRKVPDRPGLPVVDETRYSLGSAANVYLKKLAARLVTVAAHYSNADGDDPYYYLV